MKRSRRELLRSAPTIAALAAVPRLGRADTFPNRPIRLLLPFPPGGVFDIVGRPWADKVKTSLGTVFVDNQPGAGGSLAAQMLAHAAPDGYTIFLGSSSINLAELVLRTHPLLDPNKELAFVATLAFTGFGLTVHPSVPVHDLKELVAYVKANPGKLSYGSAGAGTMNHLTGEMLKSLAGLPDLPHVPYRGAGPGMADLIAGQIPIFIPAMTSQVLEFHRTGRLRLLAITTPQRLPVAPDIPTAAQSGVPDLVVQQLLAVFAPAGTSAPIIARIAAANATALADTSYAQSLVDAAVIPAPGMSAAKFDDFMKQEVARWTPLVKSIGIHID